MLKRPVCRTTSLSKRGLCSNQIYVKSSVGFVCRTCLLSGCASFVSGHLTRLGVHQVESHWGLFLSPSKNSKSLVKRTSLSRQTFSFGGSLCPVLPGRVEWTWDGRVIRHANCTTRYVNGSFVLATVPTHDDDGSPWTGRKVNEGL